MKKDCDRLTLSSDPYPLHPIYDDKYSIELACIKENRLILEPTIMETSAANGAALEIACMELTMSWVVGGWV